MGGEGEPTGAESADALLLDRYLHPPDEYTQAVLTAAMDAHRLGYFAALTPALLEQAVVGYLTSDQRARSADWFTPTAGTKGLLSDTGTRLSAKPWRGR